MTMYGIGPNPAGELKAEIGRLQAEVNTLRARTQDMSDALFAAAAGELAPAYAHAAAGALGMRDLEPGAAVISLEARDVDPLSETYAAVRHQFRLPQNTGHVLVRRIYVEPSLAPHFRIVQVVTRGYLIILGGGQHPESLPCELFAARYGSPRFDWRFDEQDEIEVHVANVSKRKLHFRMLLLGCWMEGPK